MYNPAPARLAYSKTLISLYSSCFLSPEDINSLIIESNLDEVNHILAKAGINHSISDEAKHRHDTHAIEKIEKQLLSVFINQSINIVRAFSGVERALLIYWLRQTEISNINTLLRGKAMHRSSQQISRQLFDLGPYATLDIDALLQTEDVAEVLRHLEISHYASLARYTLAQYEQHRNIFSLETSVEQQFFISLNRKKNQLSADDKTLLHPLMGRIIDQVNLVRLLRYRLNYGLSPSHTFFLLTSGGYYLKQQELLNLVKLTSTEDLLSELPPLLSHRLQKRLEHRERSLHSINLVMERETIDFAQKILKSDAFTLTSVFAYLMIRKYQLSLIHAILKGKLMQMSEQMIRLATGLT